MDAERIRLTLALAVKAMRLDDQHRAENASRFNVFDALQIEALESAHSNFLAFLLDPSHSHDQGPRFLESFLKLTAFEPNADLRKARISLEHVIDGGRVDVVIRIPGKALICIENKVGASEQDEQIGRYLNWIEREASNFPTRGVVFLTPYGAAPTSIGNVANTSFLRLLSYQSIANWLESNGLPNRLASVIEMYRETCARIAGIPMKSNDSPNLSELLLSRENFEAALQISLLVERQTLITVRQFWSRVHEQLASFLHGSSSGEYWRLTMSDDLTIRSSSLGFIPYCASAPLSRSTYLQRDRYTIGFEALAIASETCFYGICRAFPANEHCAELERVLIVEQKKRDYLSSGEWIVYRRATDFGLSSAKGSNWILKFLDDNALEAAPLAKQVADGLISFFLSVHKQVEELNAQISNAF